MTFATAPPPGPFLDGLLKLWIIALWFLRHCRQRRRLKHSTPATRREYFQERILAWSHNSISGLITRRYARGARCMLLVNHFKGVICWHLFFGEHGPVELFIFAEHHSATIVNRLFCISPELLLHWDISYSFIKAMQRWACVGGCCPIECGLNAPFFFFVRESYQTKKTTFSPGINCVGLYVEKKYAFSNVHRYFYHQPSHLNPQHFFDTLEKSDFHQPQFA